MTDRNTLYYGDNLLILRHPAPVTSVDFSYLDPPFTPQHTCNVLFKHEGGQKSKTQLATFSASRAPQGAQKADTPPGHPAGFTKERK